MKKEHREKISKTLKEYFKDKTKHPMYGNKHSEESKRKMSEAHKGQVPWMKGKHHTEESKQKSRLSHLGQIAWDKGKKLLEEHKKKISDSKKRLYAEGKIKVWNKGKKGEEYKEHYPNGMKGIFQKNQPSWNLGNKGFMAGEKHYNWKGGVSKVAKLLWQTYEYQKWRSDIFERDKWTCQTCNKRGKGIIEVHHIKNFYQILKENNIKTLEQARNCKELWDINNGLTLCYDCHKLTFKGRPKNANKIV